MTRLNACFAVTIALLTPSIARVTAGEDLGTMRGANYVPSYARNDVAIWMDYDPAVIDRELGYAERLKLNTLRVFLQVAVFEKQPEKFMADLESFLKLCEKHGLRMMPVLFDSCFDPQVVDVNNYRGKNWIPSPGFVRLGNDDWPAMEKYIVAVVGKYRQDRRIVLWDVMNEPESTGEFGKPAGKAKIVDFVRRAVARVRQEKPVQPLGVGWAYSGNIHLTADVCDVIILHNYSDPRGLSADIQKTKEVGKSRNKPVILNEFVGRPQQRIEEAMPIVAREKIGWCFWELMIGSTQFTQGRIPYQGHVYPDGTVFASAEVAAILNPAGYTGSADAIAAAAGFRTSDRAPREFTEEGIAFSPMWQRWEGAGPAGKRLWFAKTAGEKASKRVSGTRVTLVLKHGPDCGIAAVTIDGKPATVAEVDTYAKEVDWNRRVEVGRDLPGGEHTVVVTVPGRKIVASSGNYVQIVDMIGH
jgi:hypothetical protein